MLQILAHHPDFPTRQEVAEMGLEAYQPFTRMLQFMLEPLILSVASKSDAEPPGDTISCCRAVLRNAGCASIN